MYAGGEIQCQLRNPEGRETMGTYVALHDLSEAFRVNLLDEPALREDRSRDEGRRNCHCGDER
jgi:hypothetical protein